MRERGEETEFSNNAAHTTRPNTAVTPAPQVTRDYPGHRVYQLYTLPRLSALEASTNGI